MNLFRGLEGETKGGFHYVSKNMEAMYEGVVPRAGSTNAPIFIPLSIFHCVLQFFYFELEKHLRINW